MPQKKYRPIRVQLPSFNPGGGDYEPVITNIFDILRSLADHTINDSEINLSGATAGDALVTNDGTVFVPQKFVPNGWGVGGNLSVTGNAATSGNANVAGGFTVSGNAGIGGNFTLTGTATITGNANFKANVAVSGRFDATLSISSL